MYLKEIKAQGFKSFAEKIEIDLSDGINGIVGPNGSGKSNIVDAIRWVLGEQSVKSLRGDGAMTDVIFSGSKSRNASGSASVTLVFDNSDKYLPVDYTEVSIKRRVYKDGINEYFLNGEKCRLKDITDILLDSGIAKESFNIISQGKIEEILSNKPSDRRTIFEEAAGVLKYKRRKEEALRKLEKTHDNINRADDIIKELEIQVEPLKEQKDKALKYLKFTEELKNIEVALITDDITKISEKLEQNKEKIDKLNHELLSLSTTNVSSEAKITSYRLKISKLEEDLNQKQKELIDKTTKVEKINSQKEILLERKKYEVEDTKLHEEVLRLKEEELRYKKELSNLDLDINEKIKQLQIIEDKLNEFKNLINEKKNNKQKLEQILTETIRRENKLQLEIASLKESLETNMTLPFAVKSILDNVRLKNIHTTLGKLLEVEEKYTTAITTALGASANYVVVEDEEAAKESINFLKQNKMGRVTFLPLSTIKSRFIEQEVLSFLKQCKGFISIASSLVQYDPKYKNVVESQLGNAIIVDTIDTANFLSQKINYRYRIITLEGEIINVGGSITGGSSKTTNQFQLKYTLESYLKEQEKLQKQIKDIEEKMNSVDYEWKALEDEYYLKNKENLEQKEYLNQKLSSKENIQNILERITSSINGNNHLLNNSLSKEEEEILKTYYQVLEQKDFLMHEIEKIKQEKYSLQEELEEYEHQVREENTLYNSKNKELKNLEIENNRFDVKLDMLLVTLNETYTLTYEKTKNEYFLTMDNEEARMKVNVLKKDIREIGPVNINAPEEYAKVSTRYEFLISQKEDLIKAENVLLEIIHEMDEIMEKEFLTSFHKIREKFNETFKELFKGGSADLKLSDPSNILETGIEIIASPPGKKLTTISLLSGGEKTFTAISLLFAILKSREVPFCILDEVEAALDEANVNSFGEYLLKLKEKTQFILITHKKKTMEYVDVLYGITMQESGVSKLVSVRLEDLK